MSRRPPSPSPSAAALRAAHGRSVDDVIGPGLRVLFCGINPSLYSAAVGRHFARPGNRFWPALHQAGFTPRRLTAAEQPELLSLGYGITNVVARATATAAELSTEDYLAGGRALARKLRRYQPRVIAFLGIGAYRIVSGHRDAGVGLAPEPFADTAAWVLPNPSGLNAHYQLDALAAELARLSAWIRRASTPGGSAATVGRR